MPDAEVSPNPTAPLTSTLPVLPLPSGVVLPGMVVTIALETDEARATARAAAGSDTGSEGTEPHPQLLLLPRHDDRYATVGVVATIENRGALPNGTPALVIRADRRATVTRAAVGTGEVLWLEVEPVGDAEAAERAVELAKELRATITNLLTHVAGRRLRDVMADIDDPGALADMAGWWPDLSIERKIELLETLDVEERLEKVLAWATDALAEAELAAKIRDDVGERMETQQREFLLRQQLAAIRRELGEDGDDDDDPVAAYRARLADRDLPEKVATAVERELKKLERLSPQSMEQGWVRTWLDTVFDLPWDARSEDHLDLVAARRVLDADHTGLDEVKDRIVEHLAVRKLRAERGLDAATGRGAGAIVLLVGPPGVGKTSLGESVARALGREFVRVALGGIRDEAEIRGHRRTYVGAQPGRIVRAMTEAATMNPVFLLDEVDKVGADWRGDPSAALLEVLDPAQNHSFRDHYLEVELDLSDVLFIATANTLDTIPGPLRDRMEVIALEGYTEAEKVTIARDHLLSRQLEHNGLRPDEVTISDEALRALVEGWTREAGVRTLERQLGRLLRKAATRIAEGDPPDGDESTDVDETGGAPAAHLSVDDLQPALGRPRFTHDEANREPVPGVVNGLAVTGAGGDVLLVEATSMDGDEGLLLTGQLGDVMSESGQIALSHIRANRERLGIDPEQLRRRFHVHFPAGAIPKDGPSAGIAMTTALASLATGRSVRAEVGMTGEVTLSGRVLPIGGVKQKLLAAQQGGLTEVILPARNGPDLDDVPDSVLEAITVHLVSHVDEVLALALT